MNQGQSDLTRDGHEIEQTLGENEGQGSLAHCSPWGRKESTRLSDWTTPPLHLMFCYCCLEMLNNFWTIHPHLYFAWGCTMCTCACSSTVFLPWVHSHGFSYLCPHLTQSAAKSWCPAAGGKDSSLRVKTHCEWVLGPISHWKSCIGVHLSLTWEMIRPWRLGQGKDRGLHPRVFVPSSLPSPPLMHLMPPELLILI